MFFDFGCGKLVGDKAKVRRVQKCLGFRFDSIFDKVFGLFNFLRWKSFCGVREKYLFVFTGDKWVESDNRKVE